MAGFVRKEPQKSFVLVALGQHQGGHGVLHAAVTALNDAELRVGVGAKFFGHEGKEQRRILGQSVPMAAAFGVWKVVKLEQGTVGKLDFSVHKFGVCGPNKIVDVFCFKAPPAHLFFGFAAFGRNEIVHECRNLHTGSAHHVGCGQANVHVKLSEITIKLASHVGIRMPSVPVVGGQFGVPLRHGVVHALLVVAPGTSDLNGNLAVKIQGQFGGLPGQQRLSQHGAQDRVLGFKVQIDAVLLEVADRLAAHFFRPKLGNPVRNALVRVRNAPGPNVHHGFRLEGVEVQVVVHLPEGVRAVVGVLQPFPT